MLELHPAPSSARAKKGPKPGEHVQFFPMKRDHNKGFYSKQCQLEPSTALCFGWVAYLVPWDARDVLQLFTRVPRGNTRTTKQPPLLPGEVKHLPPWTFWVPLARVKQWSRGVKGRFYTHWRQMADIMWSTPI